MTQKETGKENPPSSELWYHITFALKRKIALVIILTNSVQYQKCDLEGKKEKQKKLETIWHKGVEIEARMNFRGGQEMGLCDCFNALPRSCVCMSLTCYPRTHATGVTSNTWTLLDQSSSSCAVLLTDRSPTSESEILNSKYWVNKMKNNKSIHEKVRHKYLILPSIKL